jgi:hypothetical protein
MNERLLGHKREGKRQEDGTETRRSGRLSSLLTKLRVFEAQMASARIGPRRRLLGVTCRDRSQACPGYHLREQFHGEGRRCEAGPRIPVWKPRRVKEEHPQIGRVLEANAAPREQCEILSRDRRNSGIPLPCHRSTPGCVLTVNCRRLQPISRLIATISSEYLGSFATPESSLRLPTSFQPHTQRNAHARTG